MITTKQHNLPSFIPTKILAKTTCSDRSTLLAMQAIFFAFLGIQSDFEQNFASGVEANGVSPPLARRRS